MIDLRSSGDGGVCACLLSSLTDHITQETKCSVSSVSCHNLFATIKLKLNIHSATVQLLRSALQS